MLPALTPSSEGTSNSMDFGSRGAAEDPCFPSSFAETASSGRGQRGPQVLPPAQDGGVGARVHRHPLQWSSAREMGARWVPSPSLGATQSWFLLILLASGD